MAKKKCGGEATEPAGAKAANKNKASTKSESKPAPKSGRKG